MKSKEIRYQFAENTPAEDAFAKEITTDLMASRYNLVFDKLRSGKLTCSEPLSNTIVNVVYYLVERYIKIGDKAQVFALERFIRFSFAGGYLNATRILIDVNTDFTKFMWFLKLGAPVTAILNGYSLTMILNNGKLTDHRSERTRALIAAGVDVNQCETTFGTELHSLIANELVMRSQEFIASVNDHSQHCFNYCLKDSEGKTPLLLATKIRSLEIVRCIIQQKIDRDCDVGINEPDKLGRTPLHYACILGCVEIAKLLISHGADLTTKDTDGRCPKDYLYYNNAIVTETLKSIDINPERDERAVWNEMLESFDSYNHWMVENLLIPSNKKIVDQLQNKIKRLPKEQQQCIQQQFAQFTGKSLFTVCCEQRMQLKKFLDICNDAVITRMREKTDDEIRAHREAISRELFQSAAFIGKTTEIRRLMPFVDVNATNPLTEMSALHIACQKGHYGVILALCDSAELKPLQKTKSGHTAFQLYMAFHKNQFTGLKRELYLQTHKKLTSVIFEAMIRLGNMRRDQPVYTDADGNVHLFDSIEEAAQAAKNTQSHNMTGNI